MSDELAQDWVYVGMAGDLLHAGHLNIIEHAQTFGPVMIGLLSDRGIADYKRMPILPFEERKRLLESLRSVDKVVLQESLDVVPNLRRYRPKFFVHGDDWQTSGISHVRDLVLETLKEWGGQLIEPCYTPGVSSTLLNEKLLQRVAELHLGSSPGSPQHLQQRLRQALQEPAPKPQMTWQVSSAQEAQQIEAQLGRSAKETGHWFWLRSDGAKTDEGGQVGALEDSLASALQLAGSTSLSFLVECRGLEEQDLDRWVRGLERVGASGLVLFNPSQAILESCTAARSQAGFQIVVHGGDQETTGQREQALIAGADFAVLDWLDTDSAETPN